MVVDSSVAAVDAELAVVKLVTSGSARLGAVLAVTVCESCSTTTVGETLASLRVSGSARLATKPLAKLAAAMSAALSCCSKSSSTSLMRVFREMGVVTDVPIVSASECFFSPPPIASKSVSSCSCCCCCCSCCCCSARASAAAAVCALGFSSSGVCAGVWGGLVAGAAEPPPRQGRQQRNTVPPKHFVRGFDLRLVLLVLPLQLPLPEPVPVPVPLPPLLLLLRVAAVPGAVAARPLTLTLLPMLCPAPLLLQLP